MTMTRWMLLLIGSLLLAKALILPIPLPPNTGLMKPWWDATWLHQYLHWKDQVAGFEAQPESGRGPTWDTFYSVTVNQLRLARIYLIAGVVVGFALVWKALFPARKPEDTDDDLSTSAA